MEKPPHCPNCDQAWPEEYTFYECKVEVREGPHRHWVCPTCGYDWIERLTTKAASLGQLRTVTVHLR
jgi:transposase-like protein